MNEPLPLFPTSAPEVFSEPDSVAVLFDQVLGQLATVIDVSPTQAALPTPCDGMSVLQLQAHVLGWLGFFATGLLDPEATTQRPDADTFVLGADQLASELVARALSDFRTAIAGGVAEQTITMSSSRMKGSGVLAMALGEYIIHAWDLARATGQAFSATGSAVAAAHEFLVGMVVPEYRDPDSGFFDAEVAVAHPASPLDALLGFAGRDPGWTAS